MFFGNKDAAVYVLLTRDAFYGGRSRKYVDETFGGSLTSFINSLIGGKGLSDKQAEELARPISGRKNEGG